MRFASLGSGSRGNATLVEAAGTRVLVDCGFPAQELERRLTWLGVDPQSLAAILVTHEHADHVRGLGTVARRYRLAVWMTPGTYAGCNCGDLPDVRLFHSHGTEFPVGGLEVSPFPVPHDSREPSQFLIRAEGVLLGLLTDLGRPTRHILERLRSCDALLLECNHDPQMLAKGPYPPSLRARVGGDCGHLSNRQAAQLLACLDHCRLRRLVIAHLSEKNNTPELACAAVAEVSDSLAACLSVASQDQTTGWLEL